MKTNKIEVNFTGILEGLPIETISTIFLKMPLDIRSEEYKKLSRLQRELFSI